MAPLRVRLLVVGRGDAERYAALARTLGIADRVSFEGVQDAGLERYYHAADAFIMLSAYETFCMAALEALAAGLPVIITERMGIRDLVRDGEHGYVLPADANAADVADRLVVLRDPEVRARLGGRAREVGRSHDWAGVAARLAEEYGRVAREARG
jgi:glycosyltransferase involved in cell wall biosynthesis